MPGTSQEAFDRAVEAAKAGCPVSKLHKTNITLTSKLENQASNFRAIAH